MKKKIFVQDEFISKLKVSKKALQEWENLKLIKPSGYTDDQLPFYSEGTIERVNQIQKLLDLGYKIDEIQKIIKKIGLPKSNDRKNDPTELSQYLTVGNLAERVGVSARTLKHWEDKGIVEPDMRSEGGFRLYSESYVFLCNLIKDLQLFGYTLEEIKVISDYFRDFQAIRNDPGLYAPEETHRRLDSMTREIETLNDKINLLKEGIRRWEDLMKKKKKEISHLIGQNQKKLEIKQG
ncbi:MAG: MerR family transcriptional regulator [Calditrichaceae bacterium]